ncbi:MAG: hypothetical protein KJN60_08200, partial [Boseongicola sp.]|nr:hypothetical protein [Boseongicola sp.]
MAPPPKDTTSRKLHSLWTKWALHIRRHVRPGARAVLGLLLIIGGVFGFLPVLGFWMIPLGVAVVSMDIRPLVSTWQRWRNRSNA